MSLTGSKAKEWLHGRLKFGTKPGLERVKELLKKVDNPEKKLTMVHIAGTNGKGSTVTYLRCMLEEQGLQVGTFTSPYVTSFNERIAVNGVPIPDEILIQYIEKYQPIVAKMDQQDISANITEFELLTVLCLEYFRDIQVDVAIIEVGLGGLLDSTNVITPILTGITTIGQDHADILGDTIEQITYQKAGIIKENIPVVTGNISKEALKVIDNQASEKNSPIYHYNEEYQVTYLHPSKDWGEVFDFYGEAGRLAKITTPLLGKHQVENAAVAIELFYLYCQKQKLPFSHKLVHQGLMKAHWPARMEKISHQPLIILDGAHNEHAIKRLIENVNQEFDNYKINILFSALETKNVSEMIHLLQTIPHAQLYLTSFDFPKAINLATLESFTSETTEIVSLWQFGLGDILEKMLEDELLLITGSLYFVSQVRELLIELGGEQV